MAGLMNSFTKGITTINVKTNGFMEESKCKTYITTLEGNIEELKRILGNDIYCSWKKGEDVTEIINNACSRIKEKYDEIDEQQKKILQIQEEEKRILGAEGVNAESAGEGVFCNQCGTKNAANYKFCCKCGNPLK